MSASESMLGRIVAPLAGGVLAAFVVIGCLGGVLALVLSGGGDEAAAAPVDICDDLADAVPTGLTEAGGTQQADETDTTSTCSFYGSGDLGSMSVLVTLIQVGEPAGPALRMVDDPERFMSLVCMPLDSLVTGRDDGSYYKEVPDEWCAATEVSDGTGSIREVDPGVLHNRVERVADRSFVRVTITRSGTAVEQLDEMGAELVSALR